MTVTPATKTTRHLLSIAAVLSLILADCVGQNSHPTIPSRSDIERSLLKQKSATIKLETDSHMPFRDYAASGTGVADFVDDSGYVHQSVVRDSTGRDQWAEILYVKGKGFQRSTSAGWQASSTFQGALPGTNPSLFNPRTVADLVSTAGQQGYSAGSATVAGAETHEYVYKKKGAVGGITFRVWIDGNGTPRKISVSLVGSGVTFRLTETLLEFNVAVSIPPAPELHTTGLASTMARATTASTTA